MKDLNHISDAPLSPETLDFRALLREGIAQAQVLSSAEWTDYNEHDPGVTILEYLCFALTDLGYRTAHPIEDILSSSAASCHMGLDQQPLFTGNDILCTAPLTEVDYRKAIYECNPWIKNAWLKKVDGWDQAARGLYHVFVQTFAPVPTKDDPERMIGPDEDAIVGHVWNRLMGLRTLGEDFASVTLVPKNEFALDTAIEISADTDPESAVARLLFNVEMQLNPPPKVEDVDRLFQDDVPADQIFDGPKLKRGAIESDSLKPLRSDIQTEVVLEAIMNTPGIREVSKLEIIPFHQDDSDAVVSVPTFSRKADDIQRIRVYLDGVGQNVRPHRVLDHLRHYEEKRRWESTYAMRRMRDTTYARIPTGNAKRGLSRYRSIQHYFPDVYGIGLYGVGGDFIAFLEGIPHNETRTRRYAEARQLKGYLLFFEQLLADYLAQLDHTSSLFSFENLDQTYFSQPVIHPNGPNAEDGPPDIAPVLGEYECYKKGLSALTAAQDPKLDRRERALDHLLARFNESFDNERLRRLNVCETETRDAFLQWRIDRKQEFLADYVNLSANRGLGLDLMDPRETALQKRIRLKSGLDSPFLIIEHILLRDQDHPLGIGDLVINEDFQIEQENAVTAIQFSCDDWTLHGVISGDLPWAGWLDLRRRVLELAADSANYRLYPPGAYEVAVRLEGDGPIAIDLIEKFTSTAEARSVAAHLAQLCRAAPSEEPHVWDLICPAALPIDFFAHAVSVILSVPATTNAGAQSSDTVLKEFVESIIADAIPAHIAQNCYWLELGEMEAFETAYHAWLRAQKAAREAPPSDVAVKEAASGASRNLCDRLHALYCRDFLAHREHLRKPGLEQ